MPAVVVAAGAAWGAGAIAGSVWGGSVLGGFLATAFGKALVGGVLAGAGMQLLGMGRRPGTPSFTAQARDRQIMLRSAVEPRRIVYGETVVSGPIVFAHVSREYSVVQADAQFVVPAGLTVTVPHTVLSTVAVEVVTFDIHAGEGGGYIYTPLTFTAGAPGANEYAISGATYTFHSSRQGQSVRVVYRHSSSEVTNSFFHLVIPLAGHEVEQIGDVYLGADAIASSSLDGAGNVVSGKYSHYVRIKKYLGTTTQTADADLVAESGGKWTSTRKGQGVAYIYLRLRRNPDLFPNGVPNIRAKVKGAKLYDPRTATTAWSNNWALCVYDYLRRPEGLGCAASEINETLLNAAANIADEDVQINAAGATQKRYTVDGTVSLGDAPLEIVRALVTAGAGAAVYSASTWDVYAGAYTAPSFALTVADLRGSIGGRADVERRDLFNGVRGTFVDPDRDFQPTDFPPVTNATYVTQDGGEEIFRDVELPFTQNAVRAQRLAKIYLERARQATQCTWPGKPKLFRRNLWSAANVTVAQLGWNPKVMRVVGWQWQPGGGVDLTLREDAAGIYDWAHGQATTYDLAPNTSLPNVGTVGAPGAPVVTEELVEVSGSRGAIVKVTMTSAPAADAYVERYVFEYKLTSAAAWTVLPPVPAPTTSILDVDPGNYDWRVKALTGLGRSSLYSQTRKEIVGRTAEPSDVQGFYVTVHEGRARCHLNLTSDLDVKLGGRVWIRWSPLTAGATWNDGSLIKADGYPGDSIVCEGPLYAGTYMAKFQDSEGRFSRNAASFVVTEALLTGFTTLATVTFHPAFDGTKVNVVATDSALQLAGTTLWDAMPGLMDSWDRIDSLGGIAASGSCTFTTKLDLGSVRTVRLFPSMKTLGFDTADLWDSRTDLMDSWGLTDGATIEDAEITPQVRLTNDDPNGGSPAWGPWHNLEVSDYTARGAELRTLHTSGNVTHNRRLLEFSVAAKQHT